MKDFEKAKQEYDNIPIPAELSERINLEINRSKENQKKKKGNIIKFASRIASAAAVFIAVFVVGLNASPVFAEEMGTMPIIGGLAKVLTFREYEVKTEDYVINVEIPTIEMISEDFTEFEASINEEIYALCEQYAAESMENATQYREAFLETGGTLEEWLAHDIRIKVWYEVKFQTENYLSLAVKRSENWNSAGSETQMYNLDLRTGKEVSYEEITGESYYEDNFTVETEVATLYAKQIQNAVADKNVETLAELTAFPVYVGYVNGGIIVETKDDFLALGAEQIFTEELVDSIVNADVSNLEPSMAGFFISSTDAPPSITFGIVDGQLKITGMN